MYTNTTEIPGFEGDPTRRGRLYLVGVNLVAGATTTIHAAALCSRWNNAMRLGHGTLVHLRVRYGLTWSQIARTPAQHINAQWIGAFEDISARVPLKPWAIHRYSGANGGGPFPLRYGTEIRSRPVPTKSLIKSTQPFNEFPVRFSWEFPSVCKAIAYIHLP